MERSKRSDPIDVKHLNEILLFWIGSILIVFSGYPRFCVEMLVSLHVCISGDVQSYPPDDNGDEEVEHGGGNHQSPSPCCHGRDIYPYVELKNGTWGEELHTVTQKGMTFCLKES